VTRALLYICLALFFTRVVAQVEVLLLAPSYLHDLRRFRAVRLLVGLDKRASLLRRLRLERPCV
jgi:hypothetical protein